MFRTFRDSRGYLGIVVAALLLFFWLAVNTAVSKSITNDEPTHLLRGYALWTTGDLQYQGAHTPFSHWLIGSLLTTEPTLPDLQTLPEWGGDRVQLAREMLLENDANTHLKRVLLLGRMPIILLGMLLGAMVVQWARVLSGKQAAWIASSVAAILFALAPNWLGIVSLATTDGPLTITFFAAVWGLWWWGKRPFRINWLLAGITLGLALGTKVTALLLLPVTFVLIYSQWSRQEPIWRPFLRWLSLLPIAFLVFWACYGFEWGTLPGMSVSLPAPTYAANFLTVQTHVEDSHRTFLLGERSKNGWWYYFIVAFLVKTPAVVLVLLGIAAVLIIWQRDLRRTIYLWFPAGSLFVAASLTGLNIGYRHILPIMPFIWVFCALGGKGARGQGGKEETDFSLRSLRSLRWIFFPALTWYVIGTVRQHPHHLAYFNEFVGGPANGHSYLSDSNIDWGQDLYLLADYAAALDEPLWVSFNGFSDVSDFVNFAHLPMDEDTGIIAGYASANPAPGRYAISVTHLHGTSLREPDIFDWFRHQTPIDQLGYSIFIYDVPADAPGEWIGHCTPELLTAAEAESLVNREGLRHLYFDCTQSLVFPNNGAPGWIVAPPGADLVAPPLSLVPQPVIKHGPTSSAPAYELFYWKGGVDIAGELTALPGVVMLDGDVEMKRPFSINHTANFLGYQQDNTTWLTAWQVETTPTEPLSMMAHLQGAETAVLVADSLGFSSDQWQPGDVIVQQFVFEGGKTAVFLRTGLYNYVTNEQLPLTNQPDTTFHLTP